jgi:hypothetical protein
MDQACPVQLMSCPQEHQVLRLVLGVTLCSGLVASEVARAEYSQEFSLQTSYQHDVGYHLVNNEKKPLTEIRYEVDLRYGYFLSENVQLLLSYGLDDRQFIRNEIRERQREQSLGTGILFNLPNGAKGYALSTSSFIPYLGLQVRRILYPEEGRLFVKAGQATTVEVLLGGRYFLFNRIAWHCQLKAANYSQRIAVPNDDGSSVKTYRQVTSVEFQPFGLSLFW